MKRTLGLLLSLCLLACAPVARALPEGTVLYEAPGPLSANVSPLDDGSLLIGGTLYIPGTERNSPFIHYEGDDYPLENQGYLAMIDADGAPRWTLCLGERMADNRLSLQGVMPDGRLLVSMRCTKQSWARSISS